jgi:hypothetical protein
MTPSLFWVKSNAILDGSIFPSFIRITGSLTTSELYNATGIAVFFNNLNPFPEGTDIFGNTLVSCSSTMSNY